MHAFDDHSSEFSASLSVREEDFRTSSRGGTVNLLAVERMSSERGGRVSLLVKEECHLKEERERGRVSFLGVLKRSS